MTLFKKVKGKTLHCKCIWETKISLLCCFRWALDIQRTIWWVHLHLVLVLLRLLLNIIILFHTRAHTHSSPPRGYRGMFFAVIICIVDFFFYLSFLSRVPIYYYQFKCFWHCSFYMLFFKLMSLSTVLVVSWIVLWGMIKVYWLDFTHTHNTHMHTHTHTWVSGWVSEGGMLCWRRGQLGLLL